MKRIIASLAIALTLSGITPPATLAATPPAIAAFDDDYEPPTGIGGPKKSGGRSGR